MPHVCVCSLDTGRLNPETYRLFDKVEKHYGIKIEYTFPDAQETMDLVREKGMFSFYEDGHQECCRVRKVNNPSAEASLHKPKKCLRTSATMIAAAELLESETVHTVHSDHMPMPVGRCGR